MIAEITTFIDPHSKTCALLGADVCSCSEGTIAPWMWRIGTVLFVRDATGRFTWIDRVTAGPEVSAVVSFGGNQAKA